MNSFDMIADQIIFELDWQSSRWKDFRISADTLYERIRFYLKEYGVEESHQYIVLVLDKIMRSENRLFQIDLREATNLLIVRIGHFFT
jgi:hypothetical protein